MRNGIILRWCWRAVSRKLPHVRVARLAALGCPSRFEHLPPVGRVATPRCYDFSAPSIALPCGSRTPDFNVRRRGLSWRVLESITRRSGRVGMRSLGQHRIQPQSVAKSPGVARRAPNCATRARSSPSRLSVIGAGGFRGHGRRDQITGRPSSASKSIGRSSRANTPKMRGHFASLPCGIAMPRRPRSSEPLALQDRVEDFPPESPRPSPRAR